MADRFRLLSVDGGGIRGLIAARVIARLEQLVGEAAGEERRIVDCFHMVCGTSTGGLIALALTLPHPEAPDRPRWSGAELAEHYLEDGPEIFGDRLQRLRSLGGWIAPKHSAGRLEEALGRRFGEARFRDALREVIVTAYDMAEPGPRFFKRWRVRSSRDRGPTMVEVGMATSAAPTFFPSYGLAGRALVDGGLFAANPVIAGIAEALQRREDEPADLRPQDLLAVSLGTGSYEQGHANAKVRRWGRIGWIWPRGGEPALISGFLDGQSDAAHHWAHALLNDEPGRTVCSPGAEGRGPRYYRFQTKLPRGLGLDDASRGALAQLSESADRLLAEREAELRELASRLAALPPLPSPEVG